MRIRLPLFLLLTLLLALPVQARARKKATVPVQPVVPVLSENDRKVSDYFFQQALNLRQQNRFDEAFDLFRYCVALDSANAQAWYEVAVFYNNMKHPEWGLEAMEKAWKLDPQNDWYSFGLANMYLGLKMVPKAVVLYEGLLKTRSNDENLHYQLASLYSQSGNLQAALREFDAVENLIGKNEAVSFEKFKIYRQMGKDKRAIREIQMLCNDNPYDVEYVLMLGDAWLELGKLKEAFRQYQSAKALEPSNPSVALSLADYYKEIGDSVQAQEQMMSALTNPNTEVSTKLEIFAPILANALQTADSVKIPSYFETLLDQHPNDYQIRELHVEYLMHINRKDDAKAELRTVLDLNPNQLETWKKLLQLCAEANNQAEIRQICQSASTYFPAESIFWFYLGLSWYPEREDQAEEADYKQAIQAFEKAVTVAKPDDNTFISRVYGLIGDAYLYLKNKTACYENYEKALAIHPGNILVLNNYAYYLSEDNQDLAKAERMSRKTIDAEPKNSTYLDTYAWIFFKEEKYSLAKIYIERAVANEPDPSSTILEHYGDILWFNNEKEAALNQWKKALELENPSDELVRKVDAGQYVSPNKVQP